MTEGTRIIYEPSVTMFTSVGDAILSRKETGGSNAVKFVIHKTFRGANRIPSYLHDGKLCGDCSREGEEDKFSFYSAHIRI